MVVAELVKEIMNKPSLNVTMSSDEDSSSVEDSEDSEEEVEQVDHVEADADGESSSASEDNSGDESALITNEGWADSVSKILGATKPKNKKTLVLSRAKKYSEVIKKEKEDKPAFEVIGETSEVKTEVKKEIKREGTHEDSTEPSIKKVKHEKPSIRLKPNILEKDRERLLAKIATKGVVQLFNAVRNQQKTLDTQLDRNDISEHKKEKILKKFDKRAFLDTLMGQTKSVIVDKEAKPPKDEVKAEEEQPKWSALRDDFMMGAKMKDWDKETVDE